MRKRARYAIIIMWWCALFLYKKKVHDGKNLKDKECGKGIYQRKDGLYHARFVDQTGKRHEKYFKTVPEAKNWIDQARYADQHEDVFVPGDTTVDEWFEFWIENIVGDLAPNTLGNYQDRYTHNIHPVIGWMAISSVKPMHCKKVLGLASIKTTMDRYVHVAAASLDQAVRQFEKTGFSMKPHKFKRGNGVKLA